MNPFIIVLQQIVHMLSIYRMKETRQLLFINYCFNLNLEKIYPWAVTSYESVMS